jgi:hypothetical protein
VNGHTAIIRSLGITGVLLLLALVLLAIVSAIVAFDRWPHSGDASTVERVAVDRPGARRVETALVGSRRSTPVVRGVVVARSTAGAFATAPGAGDVLLVGDGEPTGQIDGGGFGPPPPSVPFAAPGEGGGPARFVVTTASPAPAPPVDRERGVIRETTCGAAEALGEAGAPLDPACEPGQRGSLREALGGDAQAPTALVEGTVARLRR